MLWVQLLENQFAAGASPIPQNYENLSNINKNERSTLVFLTQFIQQKTLEMKKVIFYQISSNNFNKHDVKAAVHS